MERGTEWEEVAENLNKIQQVYFEVDKRAVRDRYNLLSKELRNKLKREEKESGIETDNGTRRIKICIPYYPSHLSQTFRTLRMEILDSSRSFLHATK